MSLIITYDGNQKHTVWLQTDLLAEFKNASSSDSSLIKAISVTQTSSSDYITIYKVQDTRVQNSLAKGHMPTSLKGLAVSPVFSNAKNGGVKRALPGGIILALNSDWTHAQVTSWAKTNSIQFDQRLKIQGNYYFIQTQAGLPSLTLANQLRSLPNVIVSIPNWWQEHSKR